MARPTLFVHRKFRRLSMRLGSRALAAGSLELIWHAAYDSGDGLLGTPDEVEYLADWHGEPGELAGALVEAQFLDRREDGQLEVHDLLEHAPDYVRRRQRREQSRRSRGQRPDHDAPTDAPDRSLTGQCPVSDRSVTLTPTPTPTPNTTLGGARCSREEVTTPNGTPADTPPAPRDQIPTKNGGAWWPSATVLKRLQREYPHVDLLAVARDMGRKIRAGARKPYTSRGMSRAFAAWVAAEARQLTEERARSGTKRGFNPHVGRRDEPPQFGFSDEDHVKFSGHPMWDRYLDWCSERCGWEAEIQPWPRFEEWRAEHDGPAEDEQPGEQPGHDGGEGQRIVNGQRTSIVVELLGAANRAHDSGNQRVADMLIAAADELRDPGVDAVELVDSLVRQLIAIPEFAGLSDLDVSEARAVLRSRYGLHRALS